jgi:hypothetical protein
MVHRRRPTRTKNKKGLADMQSIARWFGGSLTVVTVTMLVCGAGISQARGINATTYYEDTEGNMCVGVEEFGGFPASCAWGTQKGREDTGAGYKVLDDNREGIQDTALGYASLLEDETGSGNTGVGMNSCFHNTSGGGNTCIGVESGLRNKTGDGNTSVGVNTLELNKTGGENTAIGGGALQELLEGSSNIAIGAHAGGKFTTNETDNIDIGNRGEEGDSNIIRIGAEQSKTFIAGIYETTVPAPSCSVVVSSTDQLGCKSSEAPSPMVAAALQREQTRGEHQQSEIDQLESELRALRKEVATH